MIVTEKEAKTKWCPMSMGARDGWERCAGTECVAFTKTAWLVPEGNTTVPGYRCGMTSDQTTRDEP